jgi:hypothetical protein
VYDSETVETTWSSGGGGVSTSYSKPSYQSSLTVSGRSIPDVASLADPSTGVVFRINSNLYVIGGTSVIEIKGICDRYQMLNTSLDDARFILNHQEGDDFR